MKAAEAHAEKLFAALVAASSGAAPDAEILEETLPASVAARAADLEKKMGRKRGEGRGGADGEKPKKRKRKKKPIMPKGFDPEKPGPPPDPERWLPLRERASFRGKRKKVNIRGAQGAANMSTDLKSKEFSGGAGGGSGSGGGGGGGGGGSDKGKAPEGLGPGMEKLLMAGGKKGKKKGKR